MPPHLRYHTLITQVKRPELLRRAMVDWHFAHGANASLTAREFKTRRQTVATWVRRFLDNGVGGLHDQSKEPRRQPLKLSAAHEQAIVTKKKEMKFAGPDRLRAEGIVHSTSTIYRVLKEQGLVKKHKKRYQRRRMLSDIKKQAKALKYWQVDVKYLDDIGSLWPFIEHKAIPRYEYTARDVRTGAAFLAYAYEINEIATARFGRMLLEHLKRHGICTHDIIIQTDNGSENIGSIYAKHDGLLSIIVENIYNGTHKTIPIRSPRFNSHVESFHGTIEREFYTQEHVPTEDTLLGKAQTYLWWYNYQRKHIKTKKTPFELIKQQTRILDPSILNFPPIILDNLPWFATALKTVPYVSDEVKRKRDSV